MVVFTGVAFLLHGCKMAPDYTRPETPKADSWRLTPSTAESIANLPWWELLKDQELQRLVRIALDENLDLQIAAANIGVAQAVRFPQLALTGGVGGAGFQISGSSIGPFAIFKGSASLSGPLFNASALGYQVKATEAQA